MRVVLVHGSVGNGPATWGALRPLGERFELVVPNRGGYPPNPPLDWIDFDRQADLDGVCDVLEERLGAERAVLPGAGHALPRAPGYAERLEAFLTRHA